MIAPLRGAGLRERLSVPLQAISWVPVHAIAEEEREFSGLGPAASVRHASLVAKYKASRPRPQGATRTESTHAHWLYAGPTGSHGARGPTRQVFEKGS